MGHDCSEREEQPRGLSQHKPRGCVTVPAPSGPTPTARWHSSHQEPLPTTISLLVQQGKHSVCPSFLLFLILPYISLRIIMVIKHSKDQYLPKISEKCFNSRNWRLLLDPLTVLQPWIYWRWFQVKLDTLTAENEGLGKLNTSTLSSSGFTSLLRSRIRSLACTCQFSILSIQ